MKSIRRFQTVILTGGAVALIAIAGVVQYRAVRHTMVEQLDDRLMVKAGALATLIEHDPPYVELDFADETMPEFEHPTDPEYFQIWIGEQLLEKSNSLLHHKADLPRPALDGGAPRRWDLVLPDGRAGRAVLADFPVDREDIEDQPVEDMLRATIAIAGPRTAVDAALQTTLLAIAGGGLLLAVVLIGLIRWTISRGTRPLIALARDTRAIDAASLDHRLDEDDLPVEIAPIGRAINIMLAKLDAAFARERRMVGNIAHELRTPVAELRSAADVARKWPDDPTLQSATIDTARATAERMSRTIETLMHLTRARSGGEALDRGPVALRPLLMSARDTVHHAASDRQITMPAELSLPGDLMVESNAGALAIIFNNLIGNAVAHAPPASAMTWRVTPNGRTVAVTIANENPGLTQDDLDHLAEPFWQRDEARSDGEHSGLGLTLVQTMAAAAGAEVTFALCESRLEATCTIPSVNGRA